MGRPGPLSQVKSAEKLFRNEPARRAFRLLSKFFVSSESETLIISGVWLHPTMTSTIDTLADVNTDEITNIVDTNTLSVTTANGSVRNADTCQGRVEGGRNPGRSMNLFKKYLRSASLQLLKYCLDEYKVALNDDWMALKWSLLSWNWIWVCSKLWILAIATWQ